MALVRAPSSGSSSVGLDEAYLDLSSLVAPKAAMRRLVADDPSADRASACSVGIGPNKLVAKVPPTPRSRAASSC